MAGRRNDRAGDAGATPGLSWTRRGTLAGGLALLPGLAAGAAPGADIPIRLAGNVPWTGVWINGQGPFRFRIASGSNTFHVSPLLAEKLGLKLAPGENLMSQTRYGRKVVDVYRGDLVIGGQLPVSNVPLIPFGDRVDSPYPGTLPVPADRVTTFEWAAGIMRYTPDLPAEMSGYGKVPLRHSEINLGWLPRLDARIAGKPVKLSLSTGSTHGLNLNSDAVKRLGLWDGPGPSYERTTKRGDRDVTVRIARRGDIELGGLRFEQPVISMDDPAKSLMVRRDAEDDGEIGMDLLRRVDLILDPRRDMSWMRPNAAMKEPWEQDRAGVQIDTDGGQAKVIRVDAGSAAEAAGLKVGDVIATTTPNVQKLQAAQFMPAGTKIDLPVLRDGQKMRIAIVTTERF